MKRWQRMMIVLLALLVPVACSQKRDDLKSPCVGAEDSPCGPKRSVNSWWMA